jgi:uncharacterized protein YrrD
MDTKIQFQKNATVVDANGQQIGSLRRIVVDPDTKVLTDIVIRTGGLFNQEERVVPIEWVAETTPNFIVLGENANGLETFLPFEEEHIVDVEENVEKFSSSISNPPMIDGIPLFGTLPPTRRVEEEFATRIDQNIPEGTVAMKENAKVISLDGEDLGTVERIFTSANEQLTHLLISQGKIKKKTKLVPIEWVRSINEEEVNLLVNKISIDNLEDILMRDE